MHGSRDSVSELLKDIETSAKKLSGSVEIGVCPTYIHIDLASATLASATIKLGAQNTNSHVQSGAFTGEVSAEMLADYDVEFVIVGHSERRKIFKESDQLVAEKFVAVQQAGLIPILCVGESLQQRQQNKTEMVVLAQLDAVIEAAGIAAFETAVLAYEPIWAIGTGQTATPEQAQEVHSLLRGHLSKQDSRVAEAIRIIYGGSVKSSNAMELFSQTDIDGGLVGGASLKAEEFISICKNAD